MSTQRRLRYFVSLLFAALFLVLKPGAASALESASGTIAGVYVASGSNFAYRVFFANRSSVCASGTGGFAYLNETDSNYKTYVSNLMMAYVLNKPVNLTVEYVNGFCHILELNL